MFSRKKRQFNFLDFITNLRSGPQDDVFSKRMRYVRVAYMGGRSEKVAESARTLNNSCLSSRVDINGDISRNDQF